MKSINIKCIVLCLFLGLFSCSDLIEMPYSSITSASFFQNEQDAEAAINGIYEQKATHAYNFTPGIHMVEAGFMYQTSRNPNFQNSARYNFTYAYSFLNQFWRSRFEVINACNVAIKYIPNITMDEGLRNSFEAEARWIRAKVYFDLVRLFGDLPFRVNPTETEADMFLPRSPALQIYNDIIIPDLEYASEHLLLSRADGRLQRGAAPFLLGKVYLTMGRNPINDASKLALAKEQLQDVIDNQATYGYRLMDNFIDVFPISSLTRDVFDNSSELNDELIFVIQNTRAVPGHGTSIAFSLGPLNSYWTNNGTGGQLITGYHPSYYESFEATDERREVSVPSWFISRPTGAIRTWGSHPQYRNPVWGYAQGKYIDPGQSGCCDGQFDIILYRLADAYLMLAEAENLINGGPNATVFDALDVIRGRAKASLVDRTAAWTMKSMDDFIFEERCKEFNIEFHGRYDLVRFGKVEERFNRGMEIFDGYTYSPHYELLPIPSEEMERNPYAVQNPGW